MGGIGDIDGIGDIVNVDNIVDVDNIDSGAVLVVFAGLWRRALDV